jgi:hypothetical protein
MKKLIVTVLISLFSLLYGQINSAFIDHLSGNNLRKEHEMYLKTFPVSDSLNFFKARYYLQYNNAVAFNQLFVVSPALLLNDTNTLNYAAVYFLRQNKDQADIFFSVPGLSGSSAYSAATIARLYNFVSDPQRADTLGMPVDLRTKFSEYKKFDRKKPFVAGLLSAAVPGLGKLYMGRKFSFINTFFVHMLFASTGVEAVSKLGWKHPYTIVNLAYSGIFYFANIYASARDVKRVKKEKRKQFLLDAADYFELNNGGSQFPSR